jgi:hypothetical protein
MSAPIPVSMPDELLASIREASDETHLSQQDIIRQSTKAGLPIILEKLRSAGGRVTNFDPLPDKVSKRLYAQRDDDTDSIKLFMAAQAKTVQE